MKSNVEVLQYTGDAL